MATEADDGRLHEFDDRDISRLGSGAGQAVEETAEAGRLLVAHFSNRSMSRMLVGHFARVVAGTNKGAARDH